MSVLLASHLILLECSHHFAVSRWSPFAIRWYVFGLIWTFSIPPVCPWLGLYYLKWAAVIFFLGGGGNGEYALIGAHGSTPLAPHLGNKFLPSLPDDHQSLSSTKTDTELPCLLVQSVSRSPVPVTFHGNICISGRTEASASCCLPKSNKEQLGMITPLDSLSFPSSFLAAFRLPGQK